MSLRSVLLLLSSLLLLSFSCSKDDGTPTPGKVLDIRGADMSFLPEVRASGVSMYNSAGKVEDPLVTLKNAGANVIRLRLWHSPASATSGLQAVKALSDEIKSLGMKVLLTVHYSDTWADPGRQDKPAAWQSLNLAQLNDSVYAYTKKIVSDIRPEYIQIGNEINGGLLWPEGNISNPGNMKALLASGVRAVRETDPNTQIVIHHAGFDTAPYFFNTIEGLDYDIIGMSYYPNWHGKDLQALQNALTTLSDAHNKPIFIAETSYPFTFAWDDQTNNIIGQASQILDDYSPTPDGQKAFLQKLKDLITATPKGIGFCYWGAEWISFRGDTATDGSSWENQALWNFSNVALPVVEVFSAE